MGTTVEFEPRGSFAPVTDMTGGVPFDLRPGEWTDDTSIALCLATSLVERGSFDAEDQMQRYLSSNGRCFDIGGTVATTLRAYEETGEPLSGPTGEYTAGNGSIMRLAPVVMFCFPDRERTVRRAAESSRITHGAGECIEACRLFAAVLVAALGGGEKEEVLAAGEAVPLGAEAICDTAAGTYRRKQREEVEGSGYVLHSLEAALWSFVLTETCEEAMLKAANLGNDADTTAAMCGRVAGAFYGRDDIARVTRQTGARVRSRSWLTICGASMNEEAPLIRNLSGCHPRMFCR